MKVITISLALVSLLLGMIFLITYFLGLALDNPWSGIDWRLYFRPATLALLAGASPYTGGIFNPPWAFLLLIPLAGLPVSSGAILLGILNLACFSLVAYRLGARSWALLVFSLSPLVLSSITAGNLDGLAVLGFILPPPLGLFFVLIKPQIGLAVAIFWLVEAVRTRHIIRWFAPVTLACLLSLVAYGLFFRSASQLPQVGWNTSLFPWSVPLGLVLLAWAIHARDCRPALGATPFLSPYVALQSWVAVPFITLSSGSQVFISVTSLLGILLIGRMR